VQELFSTSGLDQQVHQRAQAPGGPRKASEAEWKRIGSAEERSHAKTTSSRALMHGLTSIRDGFHDGPCFHDVPCFHDGPCLPCFHDSAVASVVFVSRISPPWFQGGVGPLMKNMDHHVQPLTSKQSSSKSRMEPVLCDCTVCNAKHFPCLDGLRASSITHSICDTKPRICLNRFTSGRETVQA
jgi:hypothetical protein